MAAGTTGASTAPAASFVAIIIWIFPSLPLSLSLCDAAYTSPPLRLPSTDNYPRGLFLPARYYISPVFGRPPAVSITRASGRFDPAFSNQIEWGGEGEEKKNFRHFLPKSVGQVFQKKKQNQNEKKKKWSVAEIWTCSRNLLVRPNSRNSQKKSPP